MVYQEGAGNRETDMLCGLLFEKAMGMWQAFQDFGWGLGQLADAVRINVPLFALGHWFID